MILPSGKDVPRDIYIELVEDAVLMSAGMDWTVGDAIDAIRDGIRDNGYRWKDFQMDSGDLDFLMEEVQNRAMVIANELQEAYNSIRQKHNL